MARDVNRELLVLAGFESEELEQFLPVWLDTCEKVGLSEENVTYALDEYIPQNWDIKYMGIRKMIGVYLRELASVVSTPRLKEEGVKIVYGILPAISTYYYAIKKAGGEKVYIGFPDLMLVNILNGFFHRAAPFLYEAEKQGFTYGCRHCPLNKMRYAAYTTGVIACPDIIWSWGFNCDEGPKTDEFIQGMTGTKWNYHVSRIPHDTLLTEEEDEMEERCRYLADEMKMGIQAVSDAIDIPITDEHMGAAIKEVNKLAFKIGMLTQLCTNSDPATLGGEALTMMQQVLTTPFNTGVKYMEEAIDILTKEIKEAIKKGEGVIEKGAAKVGFYNAPICIPWVGRFFRDNGVIITFCHALSLSKKQMSPSKYDDVWMASAESWLRNGMLQNLSNETDDIIEKIEIANPDGMIMGFFDFDRWLGAQQKLIARLLDERLGIPTYYIEADFWDDRDYSPEALRTRIESICQIINMKKASA